MPDQPKEMLTELKSALDQAAIEVAARPSVRVPTPWATAKTLMKELDEGNADRAALRKRLSAYLKCIEMKNACDGAAAAIRAADQLALSPGLRVGPLVRHPAWVDVAAELGKSGSTAAVGVDRASKQNLDRLLREASKSISESFSALVTHDHLRSLAAVALGAMLAPARTTIPSKAPPNPKFDFADIETQIISQLGSADYAPNVLADVRSAILAHVARLGWEADNTGAARSPIELTLAVIEVVRLLLLSVQLGSPLAFGSAASDWQRAAALSSKPPHFPTSSVKDLASGSMESPVWVRGEVVSPLIRSPLKGRKKLTTCRVRDREGYEIELITPDGAAWLDAGLSTGQVQACVRPPNSPLTIPYSSGARSPYRPTFDVVAQSVAMSPWEARRNELLARWFDPAPGLFAITWEIDLARVIRQRSWWTEAG